MPPFPTPPSLTTAVTSCYYRMVSFRRMAMNIESPLDATAFTAAVEDLRGPGG